MQHIDLENKKILITGAAGFIGSYLVKEILETVSPVTVIGIDNMNDYYDVSIKEYRLKEIEKQTRQKIPVRQTDDAKEADLFEGKERENVMEQQEKQTTAREPSRRRARRGKRGQGGKSGRAGKPEQAAKAVQETPSQKNAEKGAPKASKPERAPKRAAQKNQKPERPAPQKERFSEEDNSIQLISRRAPTQKYASFEEYMKAHGGSPFAQSEK